MTYTIVICYPCPVIRQQRAQSSSIWSMHTPVRNAQDLRKLANTVSETETAETNHRQAFC